MSALRLSQRRLENPVSWYVTRYKNCKYSLSLLLLTYGQIMPKWYHSSMGHNEKFAVRRMKNGVCAFTQSPKCTLACINVGKKSDREMRVRNTGTLQVQCSTSLSQYTSSPTYLWHNSVHITTKIHYQQITTTTTTTTTTITTLTATTTTII